MLERTRSLAHGTRPLGSGEGREEAGSAEGQEWQESMASTRGGRGRFPSRGDTAAPPQK